MNALMSARNPTRMNQMKQSVMLTIASLLSILLLTFHLSGDIVRGMENG